ncbi:MAG: prohibitin family protein [Oscillospiraceae bacterium]|jgi:regulator of protease activity HflC (stomatin/prohibitin superfamily)|nr:prohibitin family protein [Oscillospiraceae bacterium]
MSETENTKGKTGKNDYSTRVAVAAVAVVVAAILFFLSTVTVRSGTVGVVSVLGAVQERVLDAGFHLRAPFVTNVTKVNTQTQKIESNSSAASKDLQTVSVVAAVNYHIDPQGAARLYKNVGMSYETQIVTPAIQESVKAVIARFSAEELITQRQTVSAGIKEELAQKIGTYDIVTDEFNIMNFDFSDEFNRAVEAKQTAQQDALKAEQELARVTVEAQQLVEQAKAEAEATKARADAEAYATKAEADAEAYAIEAIQKQLAQSGEAYLEYQRTQKWDGKLPTVGGASAFIDASKFTDG